MSEIENKKNEIKLVSMNKEIKKEEFETVKQKYPFSFFVMFLLKNLFSSFSNIIVILFIPIIVFALSTYLYPFFHSFPTTIFFPSILISIFVLPRVMFKFNNQPLIPKKSINYSFIFIFYFIFNFIWSCIMFTIFVIISFKFWQQGTPTLSFSSTDVNYSQSLMWYLSNMNYGSLFFALFQITLMGTIIGFFVGLTCYKNTTLWLVILSICAFVFGFSILSLPGIFPSLPKGVQYLSLLSPLSSSFNLSLVAFNGQNIFDINSTFVALVVQQDPTIFTNYFGDNIFNILNLIIPFIFVIVFLVLIAIYFWWNFSKKKNVNPENTLFIEINDLKKTSTFKSLFIGIPETFKVDGMDNPYKNYIFNVDDKKYNKFVADILTNKVRTFKKDVIVFKSLKTIKEIEIIHFNKAPLSGIKVKDLLNYYKKIDFNKYQRTIPGFDFNKMLKTDINCLDYDSLFYLIIFTLLFNNKKIFIIDNTSLSKISKKAVDIVERNKLYYWLINDITETY